jgi:arginyl-tRNA synthetase
MIEEELSALIHQAVGAAASELGLDRPSGEVELIRPRQKEHGDYATNIALALGASLGRDPREVAKVLVSHLPPSDVVAKAEVAGPGFINLFLAHGWLYRVLEEVERLGPSFGRGEEGAGQRVQVEYVSANPTGPLHVGSAKGAVVGDSLARLLAATGHTVEREYYVNDLGTQIDLFALSLEARYLQHFGREAALPERGYAGSDLVELAAQIAADVGDSLVEAPSQERLERLRAEGIRRSLDGIRSTLDRMGAEIDTWFHQSTLQES